jgi:spore coat protein CotH
MAGVPAPVASPVRVTLVHGDTVKELGGYTLTEIPDNPLLNRVFGHDSGHLYKPLSDFDRFDTAHFADPDLLTDYADVRGLHTLLHASNRTSDRATWRRRLDSAFDTRGFLKWLAVSTAILNWDAYGQMAHNYYLFNDRGILRWIAWDFGWSFDLGASRMSTNTVWYDGSTGGWGGQGENYPLIEYLLADPVYCEQYRTSMTEVIAAKGPLGTGFQARVDSYAKLVKPLPGGTVGISELRSFASSRVSQIASSLQKKICPTK